jgi:hypothetical protein
MPPWPNSKAANAALAGQSDQGASKVVLASGQHLYFLAESWK